MRKIYLKKSEPTTKLWNWVRDTLDEVSDEIGAEKKGKYLLKYEGWGGFCVSEVYNPKKSDEENEDRYYEYAEEQSDVVLEEWIEEYKKTHSLIDGGYQSTGLYGVTWALFKNGREKNDYR